MIFGLLLFLVLLSPTQLGLHFWPAFAYSFGLRHDYLSPTLYLTDLILLLLFISSFPLNLSRLRPRLSPIFVALPVFVFLNIFLSTLPLLTFINYLRWILLLNAAISIYFLNQTKTNLLLLFLFFSTSITSLIALAQFYIKHSLGGLTYYLGERTFNSLTPGIARLDSSFPPFSFFTSSPFILRPYSTFSHPNSLAGFLLITLSLYFVYRSRFKTSLLLYLFLPLTFLALLLSASKTALACLIILLLFLVFPKLLTKTNLLILSLFSLLLSFLPLLNLPSTPLWLSQRRLLLLSAFKLLLTHPLLGFGLGIFTKAQTSLSVSLFLPNSLLLSLQPVHHTPLLLLTELGLLGTSLVVIFIKKTLPKLKSSSLPYLLPLFLIFLTSLTDHYWLTLPQNRLLLVITLGLTLRQLLRPSDVQFSS